MRSLKDPKEQWFESKRMSEFSNRTNEFKTTSITDETNEWFSSMIPEWKNHSISLVRTIRRKKGSSKKERKRFNNKPRGKQNG